jgi:primosomal protein N'
MDVKPIRQILDAQAFVPADVVALARWTANYYAAGVGDTIQPAAAVARARSGCAQDDAWRRSRRRG